MKQFLFITALMTMSSLSQASPSRPLIVVKRIADWSKNSQPDQMQVGPIYYMLEMAPYQTWKEKRPIEFKYLNLFPEYREPEISLKPNELDEEKHVELMRVFTNKARVVINKAASKIDLGAFLNAEIYSQLMPDMAHRFVDNSQILPVLKEKAGLQTFSFCRPSAETERSKDRTFIERPQKEGDLSYQMSATRKWCDQTGGQCVRSCTTFEEGSKNWLTVAGINLARKLAGKRPLDYGLAFESEIRVYRSESEYGNTLSELTGISTPVQGVFEQSIFYVNQMIQFGKIITIIQPHPSDPEKTVASTYVIIGVKETSFNSIPIPELGPKGLALFFKGELGNTEHGPTAGLPKYTQEIASRIADYFEK